MSPGIVAESDLSGNLKSEYVFFDGERVARKDFSGGTTSVSYYFSDHLKTASVITNSAGVITEDEDYYPWGGELQFANSDSNHYKFTGKERDSETGLDYFGARYYGNWLGRWISPDWAAKPEAVPYSDLGDPQSLNLYSYVRNVPTSKADPDGHCCLKELEGLGKLVDEGAEEGAKMIGRTAVRSGRLVGGTILLTVTYLISPGSGSSGKNSEVEWELANVKKQQQQSQLGQGRGADEEQSQSDIARERARTNGGVATQEVHGNSLATEKSAQGYSLRDKDTGEVLKYGETTQGTGRYSQKYLDEHNAVMKFEAKGTKAQNAQVAAQKDS